MHGRPACLIQWNNPSISVPQYYRNFDSILMQNGTYRLFGNRGTDQTGKIQLAGIDRAVLIGLSNDGG